MASESDMADPVKKNAGKPYNSSRLERSFKAVLRGQSRLMGTVLPDQPSKCLTAPPVTRAAMVHCGHDDGSVEQQARNAPMANRTKRAGYLAATWFAEDAICEQQSGHSNKPCIGGFHHFFETA